MFALAANSSGAVDVIVSRNTGRVLLHNPSAGAASLIGYSIHSNSMSLLPGAWKSITANYDGNSGGLVDANDNWFALSATSTELAEGTLTGDGGSLSPGQYLLLGLIRNPALPRDLQVEVTNLSGQTSIASVFYQSVDADFNQDLIVDSADYTVWQDQFGSTNLLVDASGNGIVDQADYNLWVSQFGLTQNVIVTPAAARAFAVGAAVPEPTGVLLAALGLAGAIYWAKRAKIS